MIARQVEPVAELQSAFTILTKNLSLAAIPVIGWVIVGALFAVVAAIGGGAALAAGIFGGGVNSAAALISLGTGILLWLAIFCVLAAIVFFTAHGAVIAAADQVWHGAQPDIGAGVRRAFSRLGDLLIAALILGIIFVAISWTFIGPLAEILLMLYVIPAIIVGGEGAIDAMRTSWRLATSNFGPTFAAFIGLLLASVVGSIVNAILGHIPILGWILAIIIFGFVGAYQALVTVRFFELLRAPVAPPAA